MSHMEHLVSFTVLRSCVITGMDVDFINDFIAITLNPESVETGSDRFQNQRHSDG